MKKTKAVKGTKGYIRQLKITDTAVIFAIAVLAAAIFAVGLLVWKDKANIATIIAVCMLLPACKRLVNLIMVFRFRGISDEDYDMILNKIGGEKKAQTYADMLFATEKCFLLFQHAVLKGTKLFVYSNMPADKNSFAAEYLNKGFQLRQIDVKVKIYTGIKEYASAAEKLSDSEADVNEEAKSYIESLFV